ncbi:hypothetical protein ACJZ2D_003432 [Fusarium nematophilum]
MRIRATFSLFSIYCVFTFSLAVSAQRCSESEPCPAGCCSQDGFCGVSAQYCGSPEIKSPSCSPDSQSPLGRVVGYYEGWASVTRVCNKFYPEQIPTGVYTHLNFAYASIDPDTFEVVPEWSGEAVRYKRLMSLRDLDPSLKVFISFGGWTFNSPGPSASTFSNLVKYPSAQRKFIESLVSFVSTFGFDGVDIDWRHPGARDRGGREADYVNYPKFLAKLRKALGSMPGQRGLTITLPASSLYLQHYDVKELSQHIDFFNVLTHDFHGGWNKPKKLHGPHLNSHANLTEIKGAMDLLWRTGIDPDKVVLGLSFYARGFTAFDPDCTKPGCLFASGSDATRCSFDVGMVWNSEIDGIINEHGVQPTLDEEAAVNILSYGKNQWLTYENEETLKMKADFARGQCLGGVMVWAVSLDTEDGRAAHPLLRGTAPMQEMPAPRSRMRARAEARLSRGCHSARRVWSRKPGAKSNTRNSTNGAIFQGVPLAQYATRWVFLNLGNDDFQDTDCALRSCRSGSTSTNKSLVPTPTSPVVRHPLRSFPDTESYLLDYFIRGISPACSLSELHNPYTPLMVPLCFASATLRHALLAAAAN